MTPTHISGKDAPLEQTITGIYSILSLLGITIQKTQWLNPVANCWSVHLTCKENTVLHTNGKGATPKAALASGLGEFMERLGTDFFFADFQLKRHKTKKNSAESFYYSPDEVRINEDIADKFLLRQKTVKNLPIPFLSEELLRFYNPEGQLAAAHLLDNNFDNRDRGIICQPFVNNTTGKTCLFPVSILNNLYVSNGMAAGNSIVESCSQALSEIIERYVKFRSIREGIALPEFSDSQLRVFPKICRIIEELQENGFRLQIKDASLGGRFPVICVFLLDPDSGGVFASFGCNVRFEQALERTLTELLQGRQLNQLHNFPPPIHDLQLVGEQYNLESHFIDSEGLLSWQMFKNTKTSPSIPWEFSGTTTDEYTYLKNLVEGHGFSIFQRNYNHLNFPTCRIIVPGMSEIYPVDDLIWNNKNKGNVLRSLLLNLEQKTGPQLHEIMAHMEKEAFGDELLVADLVGIHFTKDSPWSTLRIGELKAMIYLALQDTDNAMEWCNWCLHSGLLPRNRKKQYQLLSVLLFLGDQGQKITEYTATLRQLYTDEEIETCRKIITGEIIFPELSSGNSWGEISPSHRQLLDFRSKLNQLLP